MAGREFTRIPTVDAVVQAADNQLSARWGLGLDTEVTLPDARYAYLLSRLTELELAITQLRAQIPSR